MLDSNVVLAGFLWPGVCTQFFELAISGQIDPCTSLELLAELDAVLHRPKHLSNVTRTGFTAKQLVSQYRRFARRISNPKFTRQICRDADDDAVLACALAAQAMMIITGDKDLLVLHPWRDIHILNPTTALQQLMAGELYKN